MAQVTFAKAVRRHVECPPARLAAGTLRDVLDAYFARFPDVRGYVFDERGTVRRHITVFVDGDLIVDRAGLTDPVGPDGEVHVFQALSGGAT